MEIETILSWVLIVTLPSILLFLVIIANYIKSNAITLETILKQLEFMHSESRKRSIK